MAPEQTVGGGRSRVVSDQAAQVGSRAGPCSGEPDGAWWPRVVGAPIPLAALVEAVSEFEAAGKVRDGKNLTLPEAVELAMVLHKGGKLEVAEELYRRVLAVAPDDPNALHYLGVLHHQTRRPDEAVDLLRRAIASSPDDPGVHNNLGNVLSEQRCFEEADAAFRAAIALAPGYAQAHGNRGVVLRQLERPDEAEASYRRAFEIDPSYREAYDNLGRLLASLGRLKEAASYHAAAMALEPHNADTRRLLTATYAAGGEPEKALAVLDAWLLDEPESPTALHLRAAISGRNVPARAGDRYVETTFDRFAPNFDGHLGRLGYRAPELVEEAFARAAGEPKARLDILDAGCGTGLCGSSLAPFARRLVGVDLSPKMLDLARERGSYHELVHGELTAYLGEHQGAFDAVVSADTLCYFGDLHAVLAAAAGALRPEGHLIFTVEEEPGPDPFRIYPHGRYAHRHDHVVEALAVAGLESVALDQAVLRQELGEPVGGLVATARRS